MKSRNSEKQHPVGILDYSAAGMALINPEGSFLNINQRMSEITGYSPAEIRKKNFWEIFQSDNQQDDQVQWKKMSEGLMPYWHTEKSCIHQQGHIIWVMVSLAPVKDPDNRPRCFILQLLDITTKKKAEFEGKELSQRYQSLFLHNPLAVYSFDLQGKFLSANEATARLAECSLSELMKMTFVPFIDPEDLGSVNEDFKRACRGEEVRSTCRIITARGNHRTISYYKVPIMVEDKTVGIYGIAEDITEKQKLEERIKTEYELSESIIANLPSAFFVFTRQGKFLRWNKNLETISGFNAEEIGRMQPIDFFTPGDHEKIKGQIEKATKEGSIQAEAGLLTKSGQVIPFYFSGAYLNYQLEPSIIGFGVDLTEQKKTERDLEKSRAQFQALVHTINGIVWEVDVASNRFTYVSPQAERILGYPMERWMEDRFWETHIHPEDQDFAINYCFNEILKGNDHEFEYRMIAADGRVVWLQDRVTLVWKDQQPVLMRGLMVDITTQKYAEQQLQWSERRFKSLVQRGSDFISILDATGHYLYASPNSKIASLAGVENYIGLNAFEFIHPDDRPRVQKEFENLKRDKLQKSCKYRFKGKNGWRWMETVGTNLLDDPAIGGLVFNTRDITDWEIMLLQIKESNERYELVSRATNDAIWDWNLVSGEITRTGDGFFNLFGYEIQEAVGDNSFWYNLIHPHDQEHYLNGQTRALQNPDQTYWEDEYRFKRKDGKYIVVYDRGYIVRDASGRALRMIGATQDITQRKEYENSLKKLSADLGRYAKELADSNAELEQFAYVASHDLQEPLRMISSFLTQLEKKYHDILDEKGKQYIHFAVDGAMRMRQIILDLLEFSRVGRFDNEPEEIDTARLVEEVQSLFMNQISEKQAVVTIRPMPVIRTHRSPLRQVFHNLLGNALKYTHPEVAPHIVIGGEQGDTEYRFFVADNGIGIAPDYFEKIFILFQRLHSNKEYAGTGMGLALCKKIINNMGGRIWVESEEGKGSTFYFSIPKNS
jgi:PAS domain S-box-containing protein